MLRSPFELTRNDNAGAGLLALATRGLLATFLLIGCSVPAVQEERNFQDAPKVDVHELFRLGDLEMERGNPSQALLIFERLVEHIARSGDAQNLDLSRALDLLASARIQALEKSYGPEHPSLVSPLIELAKLKVQMRQYAEAEAAALRAVDLLAKYHPDEDIRIAWALVFLANASSAQGKWDQAFVVLERLEKIAHWAIETGRETEVLDLISHLDQPHGPPTGVDRARRMEVSVRLTDAILQRARAAGEQGISLAEKLLTQAERYLSSPETPQLVEAEKTYREALRIAQESYGWNSPQLRRYLQPVAELSLLIGRRQEAEALHNQLAKIPHDASKEEPKSTLVVRFPRLATSLVEQGKHAEVEAALERTLATLPEENFANDPSIITLASTLSDLYSNAGKLDKARDLRTKLLAAKGKSSASGGAPTPTGGDAPSWLQLAITEVKLLVSERKYAQAEEKAKEALARIEAEKLEGTPGSPVKLLLWGLTGQLTRSLIEQGKHAEAQEKAKEALAQIRGEKLRDAPAIALLTNLSNWLAMSLIAQGKESEAERVLEQALATVPPESLGNHLDVSRNALVLVDLYMRSGKQDKAQALHAKVVAASGQRGAGPLSVPTDVGTRNPLTFAAEAQAFISQKKYAEAEAMLLEGLRRAKMEQRMAPDLQVLLAEVCRAQGKIKEAKSAYEEAVLLVEKRAASGQPAPRLGQIYQSYAGFLEEIGETEEAKRYTEKAQSAGPGGR